MKLNSALILDKQEFVVTHRKSRDIYWPAYIGLRDLSDDRDQIAFYHMFNTACTLFNETYDTTTASTGNPVYTIDILKQIAPYLRNRAILNVLRFTDKDTNRHYDGREFLDFLEKL